MPDYPGLGLPIRHESQDRYGHYPIGAHGGCSGANSDMLPIRELAMMSIMDRLTDKEEWHLKVFDEKIVSKWREEARAIPDEQFWNLAISDKVQQWDREGKLIINADSNSERLKPLTGIMSDDSFNCCIKELRSKARFYRETGIIPTLDACASIAKADGLVSIDLHDSLRKAFDTLKLDQSSEVDWHPNSNDMVQNLVHPSMYPLVYGRSKVLKDEIVGVSDAIEKWAGKGDIIPKENPNLAPQLRMFGGSVHNVGSGKVPSHFWSDTYQWLPANVAFQDDGTVKFTSYINNLHPNKFPDIYRTIEKLIETTLPMWDQCLAVAVDYNQKDGAGRVNSRFPYPDDADDENNENWIPSGPEDVADVENNPAWGVGVRHDHNDDDDEDIEEREDEDIEDVEDDNNGDENSQSKWKQSRKPNIPEPIFENVQYTRAEEKHLVNKFRESGLQIIVKMASIELTPENPEFPTGGWHIEGQMNEHICGTALYYLDSENITSSDLSFRMQTSAYMEDDIDVGQDCYHWLEQVYGTGLGSSNSPCLQNYGSVDTRQGRLLAFPNVLRFIALWLIDPTQRIISTANVPPQHMNWWNSSIFGTTTETRTAAIAKLPAEIVTLLNEKGVNTNTDADTDTTISQANMNMHLSPELMEMVRKHINTDAHTLQMGIEEAKEHRVKLMGERSVFVKTSEEGWQAHAYSFCEH
ncbi:hypothetical protein SBOR_7922 [Sclerotinia borealis F-4128]|uniref:Uncharacterized protein n=1 Tax=Sclerotinia borealis (strain F-4128) TaxID=1432307 RepID=W9C7G1_SCLBF|nr:hypothetical protein SBOR_7922 [Sclerotinia borealis F-4128]